MLAVNLGTRGIQPALDLLEYANYPSGTALSEKTVPAAAASSPIAAALDQLRSAAPAEPAECPGLLHCMAAVPDPRFRCGVRRHLVYVLALAAAAVPTGATSLLAVGSGLSTLW